MRVLQMKTVVGALPWVSIVLLSIISTGCSRLPIYKPVKGDVFEVQAKIYLLGPQSGELKPSAITTPDYGFESGSGRGMYTYHIEEYEQGKNTFERSGGSRVYGVLDLGDRIVVEGAQWVTAGSAYQGYMSRALLLTGPYQGCQVKLYGFFLDNDTNKPLELWNPYTDPPRVHGNWHVDDRYLKKTDAKWPEPAD